jgi:prepilin-type N-terminal cleavage/methylation domain-containing protein
VRKPRGFTLIEMMVVIAIIAIFCLVVFSLTTQTYGANPDNFSDQIASQLNFARMRAVSTRHPHQVVITTTGIQVQMGSSVGMCNPCVPATTFTTIQNTTVPNGILVFAAQNVANPNPGSTPALGAGLPMTIRINADGTSPTGATIFVTDPQQKKKFRVLLYQLTGSAYARILW